MSELRSCPFCGGEAELEHLEIDGYLAHCSKCDGMIEKWFDTKDEAIAAWNRRPEPRQLTMDELAFMDGKPVWLDLIGADCAGEWGIVHCAQGGVIFRYSMAPIKELGDTWVAYDRPLGGETK